MQTKKSLVAKVLHSILITSDISIFLGIWVAAFYFGERTVIWKMGLLASSLSFVLWMLARVQLGQSFSLNAKATELVTTGLYARFRHPIYLFGSIATLGALLAIQIWWLIALWLIYSIPILVARWKKEDAVLEKSFGDAFREHRKMTWI